MKEIIFRILSEYLKLQKVGKDYRARCIYHSEYHPSMFINLDKGVFHCFGCEAKGSILKLIRDLTGKEPKDLIMELFLQEKEKRKENKEIIDEEVIETVIPFEKITEKDKVFINYLDKRGIKYDTAKEFDIRKGKDDMFGRLVFPVIENGKYVGYTGRAVFSGPPKWKHQQGFKPGNYLYNIDRVKDSVVLVEGIFDVLKLYQEGITAVALFGKGMTDYQLEKLLNKKVKEVFLCLDEDVSDMELKVVYEKLTGWFDKVKVLKIKGGDPSELGKKIFDFEVDFEFDLNSL